MLINWLSRGKATGEKKIHRKEERHMLDSD